MKTYKHTQPGTTILRCMAPIIVIFAVGAFVIHPLILTAILVGIIAWIFRSLTVEITETDLSWYFGSGFPRKSVPLGDIVAAEPIRTTIWNGWGIHYTGRGWLYNVSGNGAVAITLRSGKHFCVGTDEPEVLARQLTSGKS